MTPASASIRTVILASGRGSSFLALLRAWRAGEVPTEPVLVICNRSEAGVLELARREEIPCRHLSSWTLPDDAARDHAMLDAMMETNAELVLTLGYLRKVGEAVLEHFSDRILNIHPSLLPDYGGRGMYGLKVHEAVLNAGEKVTGASIHQVTAGYDEGPVIAQQRVQVKTGDSAETLAKRVLQTEHRLLAKTLARLKPGSVPEDMAALCREYAAGLSRPPPGGASEDTAAPRRKYATQYAAAGEA